MNRIKALKERLLAMPTIDVPTGSILPAIEEADEILDALMFCFMQATGGAEDEKYDHMCLSAYENAQDLLIRLGKLEPEHCSRK